jgi:hypothetical protein
MDGLTSTIVDRAWRNTVTISFPKLRTGVRFPSPAPRSMGALPAGPIETRLRRSRGHAAAVARAVLAVARTRYSASVRGLAAVGLMAVAILLAAWDVGGVFLLVVAFGFGVAAIVVAGGDDGDDGEKKEW